MRRLYNDNGTEDLDFDEADDEDDETIWEYDSEKDGTRARSNCLTSEFVPFVSKSLPNNLSVVIKYNYLPEKLKIEESYSNQFEQCFIYIADQNGKEGKALIEE